jgi:hypothetical protein
MKRLYLATAISIAFTAPSFAATTVWTLYKGAEIVKPRKDYSTYDDCAIATRTMLTSGVLKGNVKNYRCKAIATIDPPLPPPDMGTTGPIIDMASIPPPVAGYAGERVRSIWRHADTGADCLPGSSQCSVPSGLVANASTHGAFRVSCTTSHYAKDDPIDTPSLAMGLLTHLVHRLHWC